jgi:hypothetical protein
MEYQPPRSNPREIPKRKAYDGGLGYVLGVVTQPARVSLEKTTSKKAVDTPATLPIRYAKPM